MTQSPTSETRLRVAIDALADAFHRTGITLGSRRGRGDKAQASIIKVAGDQVRRLLESYSPDEPPPSVDNPTRLEIPLPRCQCGQLANRLRLAGGSVVTVECEERVNQLGHDSIALLDLDTRQPEKLVATLVPRADSEPEKPDQNQTIESGLTVDQLVIRLRILGRRGDSGDERFGQYNAGNVGAAADHMERLQREVQTLRSKVRNIFSVAEHGGGLAEGRFGSIRNLCREGGTVRDLDGEGSV